MDNIEIMEDFVLDKADRLEEQCWYSIKTEYNEMKTKLKRIASTAGHPDAAEACRLIIKDCDHDYEYIRDCYWRCTKCGHEL